MNRKTPRYRNDIIKTQIWYGAGPTTKCPLCGRNISSAPAGTQSHVRKGHVKKGHITEEEGRILARQLSPALDKQLTDRGL